MVASGKTKDKFINACIKNIWLLTAIFDIDLHIEHVQEVNNITADCLSRIYSKKGIPSATLDLLHDSYTWDMVHIQFFNLYLHICRFTPGSPRTSDICMGEISHLT